MKVRCTAHTTLLSALPQPFQLLGMSLNTTLRPLLATLLLIYGISLNSASAEPLDGVGLSLGQASIHQGTDGNSMKLSSALGGTLDYQWGLGSGASFNVVLSETKSEVEWAPEPEANYLVLDSMFLQLRLWQGVLFGGLHLGQGLVTLAQSTDILESSSTSWWGWILGVEFQSGWSLSWQSSTSSTLKLGEQSMNFHQSLLALGYRF